jgi:hypothetical protein
MLKQERLEDFLPSSHFIDRALRPRTGSDVLEIPQWLAVMLGAGGLLQEQQPIYT